MRITILAVGTRMQRWVYEGVDAYSKRMPTQIQTQFMEIQAGTRSTRASVDAAKEKEAETVKAAEEEVTEGEAAKEEKEEEKTEESPTPEEA